MQVDFQIYISVPNVVNMTSVSCKKNPTQSPKAKNKNTKTRCEICSKPTPKRRVIAGWAIHHPPEAAHPNYIDPTSDIHTPSSKKKKIKKKSLCIYGQLWSSIELDVPTNSLVALSKCDLYQCAWCFSFFCSPIFTLRIFLLFFTATFAACSLTLKIYSAHWQLVPANCFRHRGHTFWLKQLANHFFLKLVMKMLVNVSNWWNHNNATSMIVIGTTESNCDSLAAKNNFFKGTLM